MEDSSPAPQQPIEEITLSSMVKDFNENLRKAKKEKKEMEAEEARKKPGAYKRPLSAGNFTAKVKQRRSTSEKLTANNEYLDEDESLQGPKPKKKLNRLSVSGSEETRAGLKRKTSMSRNEANEESETEKDSQDGAASVSGSTSTDPIQNDSENSET